MSNLALILLLAAAAIHAGWNALVKSDMDRFRSIAIIAIFGAIGAIALLPFFPAPAPASWPFLIGSAAIQVGYCFALVRAYDHGDLASVYPIARGSAPVFVTVGAALFAREIPTTPGLMGITLVSLGIITLSLGAGRPSAKAIRAALITGLFIAGYALVDGIGVRRAGSAMGYIVWQAALASTLIALSYVVTRRAAPKMPGGKASVALGVAGVLSAVAYGISVWAMNLAAMGAVSAVRETSILFAALFGAVLLKERLTVPKILGIVVVTAGVITLSQA
ncbi:EamA family transporter [uncultured Erythrobacter sp.]|uniref:EamA family transporter n=1 Tax=uncultured Erythrobacter sp. TaxID=263913 RepID=UPI00260F4957|nr:EamA family transporter [uncultured Erythrobacter sp.]